MRDKIEKLLRLANDKGATEAERDSALAMAQTLMMKYNIEVELSSEEAKTTKGDLFGTEFVRTYQEKVLAPAVAEMYACIVVRYNPGFKFIGRPESIGACEATFVSIVEQIENLWAAHKKELRKQGRADELSNNYRRSFRYAAAVTVWGRIREINAKVRSSDEEAMKATGCRALVVVASIDQQLAEAREFIKTQMDTRKGRAHRQVLGAGTGAGRAAGEAVKINQEMGAGRKALPSK